MNTHDWLDDTFIDALDTHDESEELIAGIWLDREMEAK